NGFKPDGTSCDDGHVCTTSDQGVGGVCTGTPSPQRCATDHYLCYKTKPATPFPATVVSLQDDYETDPSATVRKVKYLCTPANKNAEGVIDNVTHEMSYQIKSSFRHVRQTNVSVTNQFGTV